MGNSNTHTTNATRTNNLPKWDIGSDTNLDNGFEV